MIPNKMIITGEEKKRTDMLHSNICIQISRSMGILCNMARSDSRCHSFAGLGAMTLLVECGWRVRWQMCVRRFQGRNTVGKNRGWDTWTERHCHTRPRTEDPLRCGQLWELGNCVGNVWEQKIGDSAVSKVLVDRYDLWPNHRLWRLQEDRPSHNDWSNHTRACTPLRTHGLLLFTFFKNKLFWCHSILYAS